MTRLIQHLAAISIVFATVAPSIATAQQAPKNWGMNQQPARVAPPSGGLFDGVYSSQTAARAAHPITQGGTTGGTVNPGLTSDHMHHGYNG